MHINEPKIDIDYLELKKLLDGAKNDNQLFELIVNSPFRYRLETNLLFLGIVVLLLVDAEAEFIERIALSNTELAKKTKEVSVLPFEEIKIPFNDENNIIATAIRTGEIKDTTDWKFLFTPTLRPADARFNQANAGIAYSVVCPLTARNGGALIFSYYQYKDKTGKEQLKFMSEYSRIVNDSLKNLKKG